MCRIQGLLGVHTGSRVSPGHLVASNRSSVAVPAQLRLVRPHATAVQEVQVMDVLRGTAEPLQAGLELLRSGLQMHSSNSSSSSSSLSHPAVVVQQQPQAQQSVEVNFEVQYGCEFGQHLAIISSLHSWQVASAVPMTWSQGHTWNAVLSVPVGAQVEYKYIVVWDDNRVARWQEGPNNSLAVQHPGVLLHVQDTWGQKDRSVREVGPRLTQDPQNQAGGHSNGASAPKPPEAAATAAASASSASSAPAATAAGSAATNGTATATATASTRAAAGAEQAAAAAATATQPKELPPQPQAAAAAAKSSAERAGKFRPASFLKGGSAADAALAAAATAEAAAAAAAAAAAESLSHRPMSPVARGSSSSSSAGSSSANGVPRAAAPAAPPAAAAAAAGGATAPNSSSVAAMKPAVPAAPSPLTQPNMQQQSVAANLAELLPLLRGELESALAELAKHSGDAAAEEHEGLLSEGQAVLAMLQLQETGTANKHGPSTSSTSSSKATSSSSSSKATSGSSRPDSADSGSRHPVNSTSSSSRGRATPGRISLSGSPLSSDDEIAAALLSDDCEEACFCLVDAICSCADWDLNCSCEDQHDVPCAVPTAAAVGAPAAVAAAPAQHATAQSQSQRSRSPSRSPTRSPQVSNASRPVAAATFVANWAAAPAAAGAAPATLAAPVAPRNGSSNGLTVAELARSAAAAARHDPAALAARAAAFSDVQAALEKSAQLLAALSDPCHPLLLQADRTLATASRQLHSGYLLH